MNTAVTVLFVVLVVLGIIFISPAHHAKVRQTSFREPLGTPEAPELRNESTKPLQILNAHCERAFVPEKPRCLAEVKFASEGGPWFSFTLLWTLRYDNGHVSKSTWNFEGRQADGIFSDHAHYPNGAIVKVGEHHQGGAVDKTGRQLDLVNVAVEVTEVSR